MLRSMFAGVSGLRAHQTKMDVTGNNIANVNTVGFKGSQTVFQDTLSQMIRNGAAPAQGRGGTNPAQVGLGVQLSGITTNFSQGAAQSTGRATDFMISGDGFFVVRAGNENLYTRAGSLSFDSAGNLVTTDGAVLQGWNAVNGAVDTNSPIGDLTVPFGQVMNPEATTESTLAGNLPAEAAIGTVVQTAIEMYDSQGIAQQISYTFTKTGANTWDVEVANATAGTSYGTTSLTFDSAGNLTAPATGTFTFTPGTPNWPGNVTVNLTSVSQFGGKSSVAATGQNGAAMGDLQGFILGEDGTVTGIYSNGLRETLGQVALANFNNPEGLEKAGGNTYRVGLNSGPAMVGVPGTGGRGTLGAGALEMSNVDLAEEFTGLIIAQRGFQANSRVITASDEILNDLVNLKR